MARQKKDWIQKNFKLEVGINDKLSQLHEHYSGRLSEVAIVEMAIEQYAAIILPPERLAEKKKKTARDNLKSKK